MNVKSKIGDVQTGNTVELASVGARFVAYFIDGILVGVVAVVVLLLFGLVLGDSASALIQVLAFVIYVGYYWYFWTRRDGQTPGKSALGIRVVKADGSAISDVDAIIRAIGYQVSSIIFCLGYIWAIFDSENQAWHDKLARTYVVRAERQRKTVEI